MKENAECDGAVCCLCDSKKRVGVKHQKEKLILVTRCNRNDQVPDFVFICDCPVPTLWSLSAFKCAVFLTQHFLFWWVEWELGLLFVVVVVNCFLQLDICFVCVIH